MCDKQHRSALHLAVLNKHHDIVALLIAAKAELNGTSNTGRTPFCVAASEGNLPACKMLCEAKVRGRSPLVACCCLARAAHLTHLLQADLSISDSDECSAMHLAASQNHPELVEFLISIGQPTEVRDKFHRTPLHLAGLSGRIESATILLQANADVNAQTKQLSTPLHLSATKSHLECCELLLLNGADRNLRNVRVTRCLLLDARAPADVSGVNATGQGHQASRAAWTLGCSRAPHQNLSYVLRLQHNYHDDPSIAHDLRVCMCLCRVALVAREARQLPGRL